MTAQERRAELGKGLIERGFARVRTGVWERDGFRVTTSIWGTWLTININKDGKRINATQLSDLTDARPELAADPFVMIEGAMAV